MDSTGGVSASTGSRVSGEVSGTPVIRGLQRGREVPKIDLDGDWSVVAYVIGSAVFSGGLGYFWRGHEGMVIGLSASIVGSALTCLGPPFVLGDDDPEISKEGQKVAAIAGALIGTATNICGGSLELSVILSILGCPIASTLPAFRKYIVS